MYLTDYHIHSLCSDDGHNTMLEMALASRDRGVKRLCFTDHCDLDHFMTGEPDPDCFSHRGKILDMYKQTIAASPEGIEIFLGLELGEGNHNPEKAREIAASEELDFVLGSIHNVKNSPDFYHIELKDEDSWHRYLDLYLDELIELSKVDCFDVMAHIGYPVRYAKRAGFDIALGTKDYGDKLNALLKSLIERGRGIEINCAGYRNPLIGGAIPTLDILHMYKELGGEIITVGSDAHKTEQTGIGLKEGFEILRGLGYKYVTVYEKRKPKFIEI